MTPREQTEIFLAMMVVGACLGVAYDLLGVLRRGMLCAAADVVFGMLCAAAMTAAGLVLQCDVFRLFTFAGVVMGMCLYGVTFGAFFRMVRRILRQRVKKVQKM